MTDRFPEIPPYRFDQPPSPRPEPPAPPPTFRADLRRRRLNEWLPKGWPRTVLIGLLVLVLVLGGAALFVQTAYLNGLPKAPSADALWSLNRAPGITFLDRNGAKIASRGPRHGQRVFLSELPPYVPRAFLAAEDRRFYHHGPVDWTGVVRAAVANYRAGEVVQGGSTLTQQLAKTLFLKPDQTLRRKVQEAALAYRLSRLMTRDQILELYLNRIFFGANAYGIDAASQTYFGKPAARLTLAEAALLAALPKAPSRLSPASDMPAAIARSHLVLDRMVAEGWITPADRLQALNSPPALVPETKEDDDFGYVLDLAQAQAAELTGGKTPDLVVQLAIDPGLQVTASAIVRRVMQEQGRRAGARQAALVALDQDGAIRAMVGGLDHHFSPFNRAVQAQRQPGSAFKPFVYAAALEAGLKAGDVRRDAPVRLGPWTPENYGGGYRGAVTIEEALVRSINTVAVRVAREIGADRVGDIAYRFGLSSIPIHPGLSVALGAYETNLLELTGGYQVFQQEGRRLQPYLISRITNAAGATLYQRPVGAPSSAVYDPGRAAEMVRMLKGVIQRGTGVRAAFGRPAAGKTGTSQTWRDAWFIGFTPDWVCGVWVGNDDDKPMDKVTGGQLPAEIWRRFMVVAHQGLPVRDFPWLVQPTAPAEAPAPAQGERAEFYRSLQSDLNRAAEDGEAPAGDATDAAP